MTNQDRQTYIEQITKWLMPDHKDPELAAEARECCTLDGVYRGKSARIHRLVMLAYLRGIRRGARIAWEARQPVGLRTED